MFEKEILKILMSDNILSRRIQDMSQDAESQVTANIRERDVFTIRLDQSINITERAQLLAFSRFFGMDISLNNFRFAKHSQKQQNAQENFDIDSYFSSCNLPWKSCISICTGGAPLYLKAWRDSSHCPSKLALGLFVHTVFFIDSQQYLKSRNYWMRRPKSYNFNLIATSIESATTM
jgi:hypothetical protein